ncbi:Vacuolar protease A [Entomortierella beljakovae]|nr:Vacuolar protease A [Entomortierella beljakovae]
MKSLLSSTNIKLMGILSLAIISQAERISLNLRKSLSMSYDEPDLHDVETQTYFGPIVHKQYQSVYTTKILLGSPPQEFNVQVSTGTSNFWLPSTKCSSIACRRRRRFDTTSSKTLNKTDELFIVPSLDNHYGNKNSKSYRATLLGTVVQDKLELLGEHSSIISYTQNFGDVIFEREAGLKTALWDNENVDGILGLGFDRFAETGNPFFLSLVDQGILSENTFGIHFQKTGYHYNGDHDDDNDTHGGTLSLGFLDSNHFIGSIQWHEVTRSTQGEWAIELTAFALRREAFEIDGNAVIDSGFPLIALTRFQAEMINAQIGGVETFKGSGIYELPCENIPTLFEFIILFGQEEYQLSGEDYVFGRSGKRSGSNVCQSAIVGMDFSKESGVIAIFGQVFLQKYYSAYDYQNQRIGFALAK